MPPPHLTSYTAHLWCRYITYGEGMGRFYESQHGPGVWELPGYSRRNFAKPLFGCVTACTRQGTAVLWLRLIMSTELNALARQRV